MKSPLPLLVLGLLVFGMFGGIMLIPVVHATPAHNGASGPDGIVNITLPTSTSDNADYDNYCPGGFAGCTVPAETNSSWGYTIFNVTYTGTVVIQITDCCYEGDYYALYMTTNPTGLSGWNLVGTTDQVNTGPELNASSYDSYWTGTGVSYSSTSFNVPVSGTTLFAVRDDLLTAMVTLLGPSCSGSAVVYSGCTESGIYASGEWSPAGYGISFAAGGAAGCLFEGATSWPTVTFTDGSNATISVTGGAYSVSGAVICASMSIEDLFGSNPISTSPGVSSPNYYDLSILGLSAGTAEVCLNTTLASSSTVLMYWNGASWVTASTTFYSPDEICASIPVTALATASTPLVIGTPTVTTGVPEFGVSAMAVVAVSVLAFAMLSRKMRPSAASK